MTGRGRRCRKASIHPSAFASFVAHEADATRVVDKGCSPEPTTLPDAGSVSRGSARVPTVVAGVLPVGLQSTRHRSRGARFGELWTDSGGGNSPRRIAVRHARL